MDILRHVSVLATAVVRSKQTTNRAFTTWTLRAFALVLSLHSDPCLYKAELITYLCKAKAEDFVTMEVYSAVAAESPPTNASVLEALNL